VALSTIRITPHFIYPSYMHAIFNWNVLFVRFVIPCVFPLMGIVCLTCNICISLLLVFRVILAIGRLILEETGVPVENHTSAASH
jgi:hypothetical protein